MKFILFIRIHKETTITTSALHSGQTASYCLSTVAHWRTVLAYLREKHFGMDLTDTPFCSESVILQDIEARVTLADAINFLVNKYELACLDINSNAYMET